jgi:hypothetical protein
MTTAEGRSPKPAEIRAARSAAGLWVSFTGGDVKERHCETCGAVLVRKKRRRNGRPNGREPLPLFLRRKSCGGKCARNGGHTPWSPEEEATLRTLYPYFASSQIARMLGRGEKATQLKAEAMGLRKTAKGRSNAARYAQARRHGRVPPSPHPGPRAGDRAAT